MNTKSIIVLVAFVAWFALCWAWYVLGIKGKYGARAEAVSKQDTVVQKAIILQDTLQQDSLKSVQLLDQKSVLYFKQDSIDIENDTLIKNYLTKLSQKLIIVKDTIVTIVGHSHVSAKPEENRTKSYQNAQKIQVFMLSKGAPVAKIRLMGLGDSDTLVKDSTQEARYRNKRIEIFFNKKP